MKTWCECLTTPVEEFLKLAKTRLRPLSVKPTLEGLEDRVLLSASPETSAVLFASAAPQVAAEVVVLDTMRQNAMQLLTTAAQEEQVLYSDYLTFFASINPMFAATLQSSGSGPAAPQSSGSGSNSGSMSTASEGSGSPSTGQNAPTQGVNNVQMLADSAPVAFPIYNTGVDDSGAPLTDGSVDPHYTITAAPSPYTPGSAYAVDQNSYPFSPHAYWLPDGDGLSKWIGPVANETNDPDGTYTYQTTFDLTGYDPSTAVITGQYQSDNWLSEIILNGQVVANFPSNGASEFAAWQTLPRISSDFVSGVNTLDFVTTNYVQATGNPTGFRVELQGSAAKIPLSTSAI